MDSLEKVARAFEDTYESPCYTTDQVRAIKLAVIDYAKLQTLSSEVVAELVASEVPLNKDQAKKGSERGYREFARKTLTRYVVDQDKLLLRIKGIPTILRIVFHILDMYE
jgi:hypothetical protein